MFLSRHFARKQSHSRWGKKTKKKQLIQEGWLIKKNVDTSIGTNSISRWIPLSVWFSFRNLAATESSGDPEWKFYQLDFHLVKTPGKKLIKAICPVVMIPFKINT